MTTTTPSTECHDTDAPFGGINRSRSALTRRGFSAGAMGLAAAAALPRFADAKGTFDRLDAALDAHVGSGSVPGLVALVAQGDAVHVHVAGVKDIEIGAV